MPTPNIKVYLTVSGVVIVLFLFVVFAPFGKKTSAPSPQNTNNLLTPTLVEVNNNLTPTLIPSSNFTGVSEEELPSQVVDASLQKQDLRSKVPLALSTFTIDFDYSEDKFIVTLNEPKDQARTDFESWRTTNYPTLGTEQFNFK